MNYTKYIPEGQEIQAIIHQHWIVVIDKYILWLFFGTLLPAFVYYQSERIQNIIPFYFLEILFFLVFIKILYELFNWYNDVWIITNEAVHALEWSLLKTNTESVSFENIEGVEIDRDRIWDSIFNKGDIILKKFWDDEVAILDAEKPYEVSSILDGFIHPEEEEHEDVDRFDMIMDSLSGVVSDYLERKWLPEKQLGNKESETKAENKEYEIDEYTLDIR